MTDRDIGQKRPRQSLLRSKQDDKRLCIALCVALFCSQSGANAEEIPIATGRRDDDAASKSKSPEAPNRPYSLTSREIEILVWVARGKSAWEIGEILRISKRTVNSHVSSVVSKMGAVNRTHAVAIAIRDRIIDM